MSDAIQLHFSTSQETIIDFIMLMWYSICKVNLNMCTIKGKDGAYKNISFQENGGFKFEKHQLQ